MPCLNLSEDIYLEIGPDDTLVSFKLSKETCGKGENFLESSFHGLSLGKIRTSSMEDLFPEITVNDSNYYSMENKIGLLNLILTTLDGDIESGGESSFTLHSMEVNTNGASIIKGTLEKKMGEGKITPCRGSCH